MSSEVVPKQNCRISANSHVGIWLRRSSVSAASVGRQCHANL